MAYILPPDAQKTKDPQGHGNLLSLLANRIARVCASGSPSLTSAEVFHTQLRSLPTLGESFMSGVTRRPSVLPDLFLYTELMV